MKQLDLIEQLRLAGVELPELEAKWILETNPTQKAIQLIIERRRAQEPLSRILGVKQFWGLDFFVTSDVLDPRPDTEILVEQVLKWARVGNKDHLKILDLGTGTGCIPIALLHEMKSATAVAVDVSAAALKVAKQNAQALGVQERINFVESNWLDNIQGVFDVVVSNPPYIRRDVVPTLSESVRDFDPILALDGGEDGLQPYLIILKGLKRILDCDGRAFFEIGYDQGLDIARLVDISGATLVAIHKDFGGQDRVAEIASGEK